MKITKRFVDGLELSQKGKVAIFFDDDVTGFGLKVTALSKIYIVQYRVAGVIVRYTIGKHGAFTPDQAREEAREIIRKMSQGINPNAEKRKEKDAAKTLRDAVDGYLIDHDLKESSKADIRKHFEKNFTEWRDLPLTEISRQMVQDRFREISLRSKSQANQAFRNLRAWFNYARESFRVGGEKLIDENPVDVLAGAKMWHSIEPKNRRIPLDRLGAVVDLLEQVRFYPGTSLAGQSISDAVMFAILSGGRWGEISTLRWEHVDMEAGFWFISDPKNKKPVRLPLPQQAIKMLKDRPRINDFVFCSNKAATGHISTGRWMTDQISRLVGAEISPHDLRRTFRSIAAECHIELWRTKLLMNHAVNGDVTLASYTEKENLEYLRPDVQRIADYVTGAHQQAKAKADNVVAFPGMAR